MFFVFPLLIHTFVYASSAHAPKIWLMLEDKTGFVIQQILIILEHESWILFSKWQMFCSNTLAYTISTYYLYLMSSTCIQVTLINYSLVHPGEECVGFFFKAFSWQYKLSGVRGKRSMNNTFKMAEFVWPTCRVNRMYAWNKCCSFLPLTQFF